MAQIQLLNLATWRKVSLANHTLERLTQGKLAWKEINRGIPTVNLFRVVLLRYGKDMEFGISLIYGRSVLRWVFLDITSALTAI